MDNVTVKKVNNLSLEHKLFELLTGTKLLKAASSYNFNGWRFPEDYLKKVGGMITIFPLKIVSEYVPSYTKQCINSRNRFTMNNLIERLKRSDINTWKAEDLGSLAYIILKGKHEDEDIKSIALGMYEEYKFYNENRILGMLSKIEKEEGIHPNT